MQIIKGLPPKFPDGTWVAVDLEIAKAEKDKLHRPTTGEFACLTICADPEIVYYIDHMTDVYGVLTNLSNCIWVMHNAKFDLTHLRRWADPNPCQKIWDTMVIDQIMWSGYYQGWSLADCARRYLDIYLDKSLQEKWEEVEPSNIPEEFIEYACRDSSTTLRVAMEQKKIITKEQFHIWRDVELPVMWAVMDFRGFAVDIKAWRMLAERNKARAAEIDAKLPFNPRSYKVTREFLSKHGFQGIPSTGEDILETWIRRHPKAEASEYASLVLESRMYSKRSSTYGASWLDKYIEEEAGVPVIYGNYHIIGAETGRFSCSSPNMQNIPSRDTKEFRECFIARPNHQLIIADYSQQEIGIVAYISGDRSLIGMFNSGQDIYIAMAKMMYNKDIDKKDPLRSRMKSVVLGTNYGMSAQGLAKKEGITLEEAEDVLKRLARAFPQLISWMKTQQNLKVKTKTVIGRTTWLNPYSGQCDRNALNNPIQGTASDMLKKAVIRIHDEWALNFTFPYGIVAIIHDEIVLEVPETSARNVAKFVQKIMVEVADEMLPGMKFKASAAIGDNWSEKE